MIFCVEDDPSILNLEIYTLKNSGLEACGFSEAESFYQAIKDQLPDLVILDVMLPGESGLQILHFLKNNSRYSSIPVMMVTAKTSEYDKVVGLDSGADDYLTKPFGLMEFISRVKALLRRSAAPQTETLSLGPVTINLVQHTVTCKTENGEKFIDLTLKEYQMLEMLIRCKSELVTREAFMTKIWGYETESETRTIDVHIQTLRHKLGKAGALISTVRGLGYKIEEVK